MANCWFICCRVPCFNVQPVLPLPTTVLSHDIEPSAGGSPSVSTASGVTLAFPFRGRRGRHGNGMPRAGRLVVLERAEENPRRVQRAAPGLRRPPGRAGTNIVAELRGLVDATPPGQPPVGPSKGATTRSCQEAEQQARLREEEARLHREENRQEEIAELDVVVNKTLLRRESA